MVGGGVQFVVSEILMVGANWYSRAASASCIFMAGLAVATVLLPIGMLYDWVVDEIQPYEQDEFYILVGLVVLQCIGCWLNAYLQFICFLKHKELTAIDILKHCDSHEKLFSYWDRAQTHLWEYWNCYEIVLHEVTKGFIGVGVAAWILWDVTLIMIASLLTLLAVCHFANMKFYAGMLHLDRAWMIFFEQRVFDWVRHRVLLKHYQRWATIMSLGSRVLSDMYAASSAHLGGSLYFLSRIFFMLTVAFSGTIAPVLIVPLLTSPSSISPKDLWMLASLFSLVVSSAAKIAASSGSFVLHKDRLKVLREELQASMDQAEAMVTVKIDHIALRNVGASNRSLGDDSTAQGSSNSSSRHVSVDTSASSVNDGKGDGDERIILKDVTVCNGDVTILNGINLVLPLGKKIAIIGPSGAGKTTLLETIIGLRPAKFGSITFPALKGQASAIKANELFSYVPAVSNAVIFRNETWRFNLLLERPVTALLSSNPDTAGLSSLLVTPTTGQEEYQSSEPRQAVACLRQMSQELLHGTSNTDDVILDLLGSFNFPAIDLNASADRRLSQGETQRFLLARSFLSGLPAVFLDEAFSALSVDQRHALWMRTLLQFKSVFYICHDGPSLQEADLALFVMEGKVEVVDTSINSNHYWVQRMRKADREDGRTAQVQP